MAKEGWLLVKNSNPFISLDYYSKFLIQSIVFAAIYHL